ncbi:MAG TPA: translocation and assembly module protein TamB, partial [Paraburkholderia sp.]|nr:translocation and assembly module protein TamB [Paraburkholderia sp.]
MTTDVTDPPPAQPPGDMPPGQPGQQPPEPPPKRRWGWLLLKTVAGTVTVLVLLVALAAGLLYGALTTERGTAYAWHAALRLLGGRLAGTLDGGTLAHGVQLRDVRWRSLDGSGTEIQVDRVAGSWTLAREPWRFTIEYLHVGTIDARLGASSSSSSEPFRLPKDLRLPMQLEIRDVRVEQLLLHQGASTTELSHFAFHARSDGRHHEAAIDRLDTPFGGLTASVKLDGVEPFPLSGELGYAGKVKDEAVQVAGHLSGTLEQVVAELDASGMKLAGHARIEGTPFAAVPLRRAMLTFDHVNPQAFSAGAPLADLAVRAELQPVELAGTGGADGVGGGAASTASVVTGVIASGPAGVPTPASTVGAAKAASAASAANIASQGVAAASAAQASAPAESHGHHKEAKSVAGFAVAGHLSIVNAKPGAIDQDLLPLIDANADVRLDAQSQSISNLNVRIVRNATVTGGGTLRGRRGQFDLRVARLDLNALQATVRPTQLSGPIGIRLNDDIQSVTLDLADPAAALRAQGKITFDPARISFNDVRVTSGRGRIDLSGALKHDANATYNLKAQLTDFDPLSLTSQMPSRTPVNASAAPATSGAQRARPTQAAAPAGSTAGAKSSAPGDQAAAIAKNTAKAAVQTEVLERGAPTSPPAHRATHAAAPVRKIEARVNATLNATGVLAPTFTTRAEFKLGPSVYNDLPLTGGGMIQLAGSRILPSRANLSVAGNQV